MHTYTYILYISTLLTVFFVIIIILPNRACFKWLEYYYTYACMYVLVINSWTINLYKLYIYMYMIAQVAIGFKEHFTS